MRMMDEWERENGQKCAVIAREKGFPSWDAYEDHLKEQLRQADLSYERRMEEKAAMLGKTREELAMEDPQRFIPDTPIMECDCEGKQPVVLRDQLYLIAFLDHPIPFFCPKALVNYRSQEVPYFMDQLARKRLQLDDMKIKSEDKSRRLDQDILEKLWIMDYQQDLSDVPFWAKADPVVRQMLNSRSPSPPLQVRLPVSGLSSPKSSPSSDLTITKSWTTISTASATPTPPTSKYEVCPTATPLFGCTSQSQLPNDPTTPQKCSKAVYSSNSQDKPISRTKATQHSRKKIRTNTTVSKIRKGMRRKPAMGTRSRNVSYFYELGWDDAAVRRS